MDNTSQPCFVSDVATSVMVERFADRVDYGLGYGKLQHVEFLLLSSYIKGYLYAQGYPLVTTKRPESFRALMQHDGQCYLVVSELCVSLWTARRVTNYYIFISSTMALLNRHTAHALHTLHGKCVTSPPSLLG